MHRNSIVYHIHQIKQKTGLNPDIVSEYNSLISATCFRREGKWVPLVNSEDADYSCSECGNEINSNSHCLNFCSKCGAVMTKPSFEYNGRGGE